MIKCVHCKKEIVPVKTSFSWLWFIVWFFFGLFPAAIYLIYHMSKKPVRCPACGKNAYK